MTDGIVQKVIGNIVIEHQKYIKEHHCAGIIMKIQTELIEEIKKEFPIPKTLTVYDDKVVIKKLIGGNE